MRGRATPLWTPGPAKSYQEWSCIMDLTSILIILAIVALIVLIIRR